MPRIIRILNRLAVGGPVLNATYLTKYLSPSYDTLLVVGEKEDHEQSAAYLADNLGIECVTIAGMGRSLNARADWSAYGQMKALIKSYKPDIVHTHSAKPGAIGRMAASAARVPAIVHTFHGHVFHSYFNAFKSKVFIQTERALARRSHAIVAISTAQKRELVEDFKIAPAEKVRIVPLGFDLDRFVKDREEKRTKFRNEFGLAENEIAIGIIGRLVPVKNHELFLQGLHHVLSHTSKKIRAFVIGDGETRGSLEQKAQALGISFTTEKHHTHPHPLVFTSWRSDVDVINAGLDIVALTSVNEGTPVSLIEAQAANKAIVSTRVGGIADIVEEGQTALLSDVTDSEAFCRHLLQLVEDDALRQRLGENSSSFVLQRFSYQRLVSDMDQLYQQLLNNSKS